MPRAITPTTTQPEASIVVSGAALWNPALSAKPDVDFPDLAGAGSLATNPAVSVLAAGTSVNVTVPPMYAMQFFPGLDGRTRSKRSRLPPCVDPPPTV